MIPNSNIYIVTREVSNWFAALSDIDQDDTVQKICDIIVTVIDQTCMSACSTKLTKRQTSVDFFTKQNTYRGAQKGKKLLSESSERR